MVYTPTAWVNGTTPYLNATNLNKIEAGVAAARAHNALLVAAYQAPQSVKDMADYICDGTADEVQINQAMIAASRPGDGLGGLGYGAVQLVGPTFVLAAPIKMPPTTTLRGSGYGTLLKVPTTSVAQGAIELLNTNSHRVTVESLTIGRETDTAFGWDGIKFQCAATGDTYEIMTANDSYCTIRDVLIGRTSRRGIYVGGTSPGTNGCREVQIHDTVVYNAAGIGIEIDAASDAKIRHCVIAAGGPTSGIKLSGGNSMIVGSKVFYRGNYTGGGVGTGFEITSSRCHIHDCEAQDNGGYGFSISSTDATVTGCLADSNAAMNSAYSGFYITGAGVYDGIHATWRAQNTNNQDRGIIFSGSPQVYASGRVSVSTGANHVAGTLGTGSSAAIVRNGTTVWTG